MRPVAGVHGRAVTCKKNNTVSVVFDGEEMESRFAQAICDVDKLGMLVEKLLSRGLINSSGIHQLVEQRIV
ncbi:MAG: hypothetical protein L0Y58_21075 [Verrucomicrobia subdivision 3 bacterium]|nr:hypothetical protein [Limisphaerales bacterium]